MTRARMVAAVVVAMVAVAALDFWTSSELVGSILFTFPLALCALQRSRRLLWGTASAAVLLTVAAEFWGFDREPLSHPLVASVNRLLLIASLLTLTTFIHFWIQRARRIERDAAEIGRQRNALVAQNEQLDLLVAAATSELSVRKAAEEHLGRTTRELTLQHQLLDAVVEGTTDAVYVKDLEGRFILVNSAGARMLGVGVKEVLGKSLHDLLPNESADVMLRSDQAVMRAGVTSTVEEVAEINGIPRLFAVTKGPYRDADQRIIGTVGIAREITEQRRQSEARVEELTRDISVRKAAEKHLAQMEGRYRGLLEAAPDAMVVVNPAGEIVLLNVQAEKQFGYRRDELVGQQVKRIIPQGFAERLLADGLRSVEDALAQQIGTGIELTGRRKDGSDFPIEIMLSPLQSNEGILVTAAIRDISVRKAAEEHLARVESKRRLVDEALRQSEEQSRMVLDGIQNYAIFMMDPGGKIVSWNAGAERIKGYPAAEIIGRNFACFFPPEDIERGRPEEVLRLATSRGRYEEQGVRVRKDGSHFLASITLTALRDQSGSLRGFSEFSHDLSEIKESEARYRGLLEAAPDAMVVVNQGGNIVLLNLQAEKQFGYSGDELVGQEVKNIIPQGFAERLLADGLRSVEDALAQQIGTGIELIGQRKDGSDFPIEIMLSPLQSSEGILVTAAIRDISVRKAAEKHLAQMEGRYRGLLEAAPDAMVVVNPAGEIVLLNVQAEKQFGYRRDELVGQQVKRIIPQGFAERLLADGLRSVEDALAQQIGTGIELVGRRKDASAFPIEIMLSPLESADGILVTVAVRDISVRKAAEARLRQKMEELNRSNGELEQFAYIASHDLQEPLRMVASYTQLLSRRYKGKLDADADEFIAFAVDGASRMQRLIQDLLTYSRVATKGRDLLPTSSEEALQHALANLRGAIEKSGALVTYDSLPAVMADETQLVQLFQNLVGNGIKYQSQGVPRIHVSAARNGGKKWVFSVKDNGLGIEPQYFEKIFGMFQRLHRRDQFEGTGIGLAICKKIVERHGGHILLESQLGHGSTFRFALAGSEGQS